MKIHNVEEYGEFEALFGLGLSYGLTSCYELDGNWNYDRVYKVACRLAKEDGGHNKFLESIQIWIDISAPRYWWQEADTYRMGTKQSESTIHTLLKGEITPSMFEGEISPYIIDILNEYRQEKDLINLKRNLPESFLQRRMWNINYKTLRNIIKQRKKHKLPEWEYFIITMLKEVEFPEFLIEL